ncbi:unnamed protein product [Sphagnum tenellum]
MLGRCRNTLFFLSPNISLGFSPLGSVAKLVASGIREVPPMFRVKSKIQQGYCTTNACDDDDDDEESTIPVIDFAGFHLTERRPLILQQIRRASEDWGFFQIINHGVAPALLNDILHTHKEFFEMPLEEQMKYYSKDTNAPFKFSVIPLLPPHLIQPWKDGLTVIYSKGMDTTNWPTKPTTFIDVTLQYNEAVNVLKRELLAALSESLGLQSSFIDDLCGEFQKSNSNYYPPCPEPQYAFGARPHSDPTTITLLLQDHVGGLEVRDKHGEWMQVKPIPHAFVINLGDQLEIISNGRYKSVEHRVTVNSNTVRISFATFIYPSKTTKVGPPLELVNLEEGEPYKDFIYGDYLAEFVAFGIKGKRFIDHVKTTGLHYN